MEALAEVLSRIGGLGDGFLLATNITDFAVVNIVATVIATLTPAVADAVTTSVLVAAALLPCRHPLALWSRSTMSYLRHADATRPARQQRGQCGLGGGAGGFWLARRAP